MVNIFLWWILTKLIYWSFSCILDTVLGFVTFFFVLFISLKTLWIGHANFFKNKNKLTPNNGNKYIYEKGLTTKFCNYSNQEKRKKKERKKNLNEEVKQISDILSFTDQSKRV